jgi:4-hydroxybutyrate CoA-transferase
MHTMGEATYARPEHADSFFTNCLFVGANLRAAVNRGSAAYVPIFLGQIPRLC